jgi:hypothetical protein
MHYYIKDLYGEYILSRRCYGFIHRLKYNTILRIDPYYTICKTSCPVEDDVSKSNCPT